MEKKSMLKKMLIRYGLQAANKPSFRGCYESPVPKEAMAFTGNVTKASKKNKFCKYKTDGSFF